MNNPTLKTLTTIRSEGPCPDCHQVTVSLHIYPPAPGGLAICASPVCSYVERFQAVEAAADPVVVLRHLVEA